MFENLWGALVDGFELLFMVEVMRCFVLDFEVAESSHLLLHVDKVAIEEAFFLDEVVEVELLEPVRCDVLFIGLIGGGVAVMAGFGVFVGLREWFLFMFGNGFGFGLGLGVGFGDVGGFFESEGIGSFFIDFDEEVFDLGYRKRYLFEYLFAEVEHG
jgi:hypothetical protein